MSGNGEAVVVIFIVRVGELINLKVNGMWRSLNFCEVIVSFKQ